MVVEELDTSTSFLQKLKQSGTRPVFVDFFATWCGPCRNIAPVYEQLSEKYGAHAVFLKVDVDKLEDIARAESVTAMPTFAIYRETRKMETVRGANPAKLEELIKKWTASNTAGEDSVINAESIPRGQMNLSSFIDQSGSECLNESDDHTLAHALSSKGGYLESDCDEQLIISVRFNQLMKLHSLAISVVDEVNYSKAPKTVKVFANLPNSLDFDSAEGMEPVQLLELTAEDLKVDSLVPLKYVKFQNVQSVTLFVKDNQGNEDTTVIDNLVFIGTTVSTTNMDEFKRVAGKKGESH